MSSEESLEAIGIQEGTDKSPFLQDYLTHYDRVFSPLRHEPILLLEIGVAQGASLKTWERYFSKATIVGVDTDPRCARFANDRIKIEIGSQNDIDFLAALTSKYQPDIIIDDGSHQAADIMFSFDRLFPSLAPGGFYVAEDLYLHYGGEAAYWNAAGVRPPSEEFASYARAVCADDDPRSGPLRRDIWANIHRIEFIRRAVIVQKSPRLDIAQHRSYLWEMAEASGHALNWHELAGILIRNDDLERAGRASEHAVALASDVPAHFSRLAYVQHLRGKLVEAKATIRAGLEIAPHNAELRGLLATLEREAGA